MKKRFLAILLALCLLPVAALGETTINQLIDMYLKPRATYSPSPKLPDLKAYASEQLKDGKREEESYLVYWRYSGKPSTIAAVAEAYVQLLQDEFQCTVINHFTVDMGNYAATGYAFSRESSIELNDFYVYNSEEDGRNWNSGNCHVFVSYTIPDSGTSYIHFYYSPEFVYTDEGYRYVMETGESEKVYVSSYSAKPTEKPDASTSATK